MIFSWEDVNENLLTPDGALMSGQMSNQTKVNIGKSMYLLGLCTVHGSRVTYRVLSEPKAASSLMSHTRMNDNFFIAAIYEVFLFY